ncbi:hypothetical protein HYS48_03425 [Candidatus Woesearchaeota archaeon]|nr:hypothetical protein [Candidatus Woesearchaeota archaeon]
MADQTWEHNAESFILTGGEGYLLLRKHLVVVREEERVYVAGFDLAFPTQCTAQEIKQGLTEAYRELEKRAARGILSEPEMERWKRICEYVDREAMLQLQMRKSPDRDIFELVESAGEKRIRAGLCEYAIPPHLREVFRSLQPGFYDADIITAEEPLEEPRILSLDCIVALHISEQGNGSNER